MRDEEVGRDLSDDEARALAERLVREAHESPQHHDGMLSDSTRRMSDADEDRIEQALVEMGAADFGDTTMSEREPERREGKKKVEEMRRPE